MKILFISHYDNMYGANRALLSLILGMQESGAHQPFVTLPAEGESVPQEEKDKVIGKLKKMVKSEIGNFGYCDMNHLLQEASAASQSDNAMLRLFDEMMKRPDIGESDLAEYALRKIANGTHRRCQEDYRTISLYAGSQKA